MGSKEFLEICKEHVVGYFNAHCERTDDASISSEDVYVVWYCKTLQNQKALLSTNVSDGMYYELTFNRDKNQLYMDAYKKWQNICFDM